MTVAFYTFGCKVNAYETAFITNEFKKRGYKVVDFKNTADIFIINTCSITNKSDFKCRKIINQVNKRKGAGVLVVIGCYPERDFKELAKIKGIDIIVGNNDKSKITDYVKEFLDQKKPLIIMNKDKNKVFDDMKIDYFENKARALVKIQDGCQNFCSYCIIPYIRGNNRSKAKDKVIKEVSTLTQNGHYEIVLTGIHLGHYGKDLINTNLSILLSDLLKINNLESLRLSSIEVTDITPSLIKVIGNNNIIANHLHIPLQSGSDKILNLMNRNYNATFFKQKIKEIRKKRPNISITTDIIVGFPSESEDDFNKTIKIINDIKFADLHIFPYSKREGTKASLMANQVDPKIKKERVNKLIKLSKKLKLDYMNKFINKELLFIPETVKGEFLLGHTTNYLKVKIKDNKEKLGKQIKIVIKEIDFPYGIGEKRI